MESVKNQLVEAIEDGRIVRVPESYALREGLPILRKKEFSFLGDPAKQNVIKEANKRESKFERMDTFRKPLKAKKSEVLSSLIDNFHWTIAQKRKEANISRKQLAEKTGVLENDIKLIENGILPHEDYILINKIEQIFNINLRKDGINFNSQINSKQKNSFRNLNQIKTEKEISKEKISGEDIEIELEE